MSTAGVLHVFCIDASESAHQNEDFEPSRWGFQLDAVSCMAKALVPVNTSVHSSSPSSSSASFPAAHDRFAVVGMGSRAQVLVPATADCSTLAGLQQVQSLGDNCNLMTGLKTALLVSRKFGRSQVVAFVSSEAAISLTDAQQLGSSFGTAGVSISLVLLGPVDNGSADLKNTAADNAELGLYSGQVKGSSSLPIHSTPATGVTEEVAMHSNTTGLNGLQRLHSAQSSMLQARDALVEALTALVEAARQAALLCRTSSLAAGSTVSDTLSRVASSASATTVLSMSTTTGDASIACAHTGNAGSSTRNTVGNISGILQPSGSGLCPQTSLTSSAFGPGGYAARLLLFPAPPSGLPLWQQLEPLLEELEIDVQASQNLDEHLQPSGSPNTHTNRPFMARGRDRQRTLPRRPPALQVGRHTAFSCREESLDSIQHLSADGFMRSWLPSYSNLSGIRVTAAPSSSGTQMCFISVYQMQTPRWHKLLEIQAGLMLPTPTPAHEQQSQPTGIPQHAVHELQHPPDSCPSHSQIKLAADIAQSSNSACSPANANHSLPVTHDHSHSTAPGNSDSSNACIKSAGTLAPGQHGSEAGCSSSLQHSNSRSIEDGIAGCGTNVSQPRNIASEVAPCAEQLACNETDGTDEQASGSDDEGLLAVGRDSYRRASRTLLSQIAWPLDTNTSSSNSLQHNHAAQRVAGVEAPFTSSVLQRSHAAGVHVGPYSSTDTNATALASTSTAASPCTGSQPVPPGGVRRRFIDMYLEANGLPPRAGYSNTSSGNSTGISSSGLYGPLSSGLRDSWEELCDELDQDAQSKTPVRLVPDLRKGRLTLLHATDGSREMKLIWRSLEAEQQYSSIFDTVEHESAHGLSNLHGAELIISLSHTRSKFSGRLGPKLVEVLHTTKVLHTQPVDTTNSANIGCTSSQSSGHHPTDPSSQPSNQRSRNSSKHTTHQSSNHTSTTHSSAPSDVMDPTIQHASMQSSHNRSSVHPSTSTCRLQGNLPCVFWLQEDFQDTASGTHSGHTGSSALAERLQALLEQPPEFDPQRHGVRSTSAAPLQLGPLPFSVVQEMLQYNGRQLVEVDAEALSRGAAAAAPASGPVSLDSRTVSSFCRAMLLREFAQLRMQAADSHQPAHTANRDGSQPRQEPSAVSQPIEVSRASAPASWRREHGLAASAPGPSQPSFLDDPDMEPPTASHTVVPDTSAAGSARASGKPGDLVPPAPSGSDGASVDDSLLFDLD